MSMSVPGRFEGRTVIVTGAGAGIGRATAERLLAEGARVIATDIDAGRLSDLESAMGSDGDLVTLVGDVTRQETVDALITAAGERIDGLANVAGIMDAFLPPHEMDDSTWERVFDINLNGPMKLTRAVLPLMRNAGSGSIVNVSSEAGLRASASGAAYTSSKHAVIGLTKSTAFFYADEGIRVNSVAPGAVATSIEAPMHSELAQRRVGPIMQATVPPPATSEQLAAAITWLLSDDSANVNGAILPSDGGWSAI